MSCLRSGKTSLSRAQRACLGPPSQRAAANSHPSLLSTAPPVRSYLPRLWLGYTFLSAAIGGRGSWFEAASSQASRFPAGSFNSSSSVHPPRSFGSSSHLGNCNPQISQYKRWGLVRTPSPMGKPRPREGTDQATITQWWQSWG